MSKICIVTLGCPKNQVEGELIAGMLSACGHELTTDINSADDVVLHTCAFIRDAKKESETFIKALSKLKVQGKIKKIFVSGCLAQAEGSIIPGAKGVVDGYIGTGKLSELPSIISSGTGFAVGRPGSFLESDYPRLLSGSSASAYLRIADGCGHKCSFCLIPKLRGKYQSRSAANITEEAKELADLGISELVLVAQDTTSYGIDICGKYYLPQLLRKLSKINGIKWIRLMYAFPSSVTDSLLKAYKESEKLCRYIDVPLQHVSSSVLKKMARPPDARKTVERIKKALPDISIRTALITGFPGETENDFNELLRFVSEGWFDNLGVFAYSDMPGVKSFSINPKISPRRSEQRRALLMEEQKKVLLKKNRAKIGKTVEVLVEKNISHVNSLNHYSGRTRHQAPEIDGNVIFCGKAEPGAFVRVRITGFRGYDLLGEQVGIRK